MDFFFQASSPLWVFAHLNMSKNLSLILLKSYLPPEIDRIVRKVNDVTVRGPGRKWTFPKVGRPCWGMSPQLDCSTQVLITFSPEGTKMRLTHFSTSRSEHFLNKHFWYLNYWFEFTLCILSPLSEAKGSFISDVDAHPSTARILIADCRGSCQPVLCFTNVTNAILLPWHKPYRQCLTKEMTLNTFTLIKHRAKFLILLLLTAA